MIPKLIKIKREEDYHTHYVGTYADGKIFVGFPFFAERNQQRPLAVIHLMDVNGTHVESTLWEAEKMFQAEAELRNYVDALPNRKFEDVAVKQFSIKKNGLIFGLIASDETERVSYEPYGLAFFPPWDGTYET